MKHNKFSRKVTSAFILSAWACSASAGDWICSGTDFWDKAACWLTNAVPVAGESVNAINYGATNTEIIYQNTVNPGAVLGRLIVDSLGTGTMTIRQNANYNMNVGGLVIIGRDRQGSFIQSAGTNVFNHGTLGAGALSNATYELSGTGSVTWGALLVGNAGHAEFLQNGGSNTVNTTMSHAEAEGSSSVYTLNAGTLSVLGTEYVGYWGNAQFNQNGGLHTVNHLDVGRKRGTGTYNMNAGTLIASNGLVVGTIPGGTGHFIQNGGDVSITNAGNSLVVSATGGATGIYELKGGTVTAPHVLNNDTFEYSGGTLTANFDNHDTLSFSGAGVREVFGDVHNVGETYYYVDVNYEETKNGIIEIADGTRVSIHGDLFLEELGTLAIELGDAFIDMTLDDWITVDNNAVIAGALDLSNLLPGVTPMDGDSWTILSAASVSGVFDNVLFPMLPDWDWNLIYEVDSIILSATSNIAAPVPLPAAFWLFATGLLSLAGLSRRRS